MQQAESFLAKEILDSAKIHFLEAASFYKEVKNWKSFTSSYNAAALACLEYGQIAEALNLLNEARKNREIPETGEHFSENLYYTGYAYYLQYEPDSALAYYQRTLEIRENLYGKNHIKVADIHDKIGLAYDDRGDYQDALKYKLLAIKIAQELTGEELALGDFYTSAGASYELIGNYEKALSYYEEGFKYRRSVLDSTHLYIAASYNNIALIQEIKGAYEQALKNYLNALEIFEINQDTVHMAEVYLNLGILLDYRGEYTQALNYFQRVLDIYKPVEGDTDAFLADTYNDIANVYLEQKEYTRALNFYKRALSIREKVFGKKSIEVAAIYDNLGETNSRQERYKEAIENFDTAIKIEETILGSERKEVALRYLNMAQVYKAQENYDKALQLLENALDIEEKIFEGKHPFKANLHNNLAQIYYEQGRYTQSMAEIQKAFQANLQDYEVNEQSTRPSIENYYNYDILFTSLLLQADVLEKIYLQNPQKAATLQEAYEYLLLADQLIDRNRGQVKTNADKLRLSEHVVQLTQDGIDICQQLHRATNDPSYLEKAYDFAQKSKSHILLEALSDADAKSFAGIPDSLLQKEKDFKTEITYYEQQLALKPDSTREIDYRRKLFEFNRDYQAFVDRLEKDFPKYYQSKYEVQVISIAKLQNALDQQTALVDLVLGDSLLHIFTITQQDYDLQSVSIDYTLAQDIRSLRNGIINRADFFQLPAQRLYQKLFPKTLPKHIQKLVILPDAKLSSVPFEVLLTEAPKEGKSQADLPYLIKKYQISYDYSPVLFYQNTQAKPLTTPKDFLAYAPVFEGNIKLDRGFRDFFSETDSSSTTRSVLGRSGRIPAIPATKTEIERIQQLFLRAGKKAEIFANNKADEVKVKLERLQDFKYIHFATHGFVNQDQPKLSGMLMFPDTSSTEDGFLSMGEIYNLKMNAELVALSACETGLGKISPGEGTIGLTRAFIYAGAKNVMVSLWQVADQSTSQLMIDFYQNLIDSQEESLAESLRHAKLRMIQADGENAHPYYWSPFVLIGK